MNATARLSLRDLAVLMVAIAGLLLMVPPAALLWVLVFGCPA